MDTPGIHLAKKIDKMGMKVIKEQLESNCISILFSFSAPTRPSSTSTMYVCQPRTSSARRVGLNKETSIYLEMSCTKTRSINTFMKGLLEI